MGLFMTVGLMLFQVTHNRERSILKDLLKDFPEAKEESLRPTGISPQADVTSSVFILTHITSQLVYPAD